MASTSCLHEVASRKHDFLENWGDLQLCSSVKQGVSVQTNTAWLKGPEWFSLYLFVTTWNIHDRMSGGHSMCTFAWISMCSQLKGSSLPGKWKSEKAKHIGVKSTIYAIFVYRCPHKWPVKCPCWKVGEWDSQFFFVFTLNIRTTGQEHRKLQWSWPHSAVTQCGVICHVVLNLVGCGGTWCAAMIETYDEAGVCNTSLTYLSIV